MKFLGKSPSSLVPGSAVCLSCVVALAALTSPDGADDGASASWTSPDSASPVRASAVDEGPTGRTLVIRDLLGIDECCASTCYVKDVKPFGTPGGDASSDVLWITRDLNTLEGECAFLDLEDNRFTLQPGRYDVHAVVPSAITYPGAASSGKARLRDLTNARDAIIGTSAGDSSSLVIGPLSVVSATTFEIQHYLNQLAPGDELGAPTFAWTEPFDEPQTIPEVYTVMTITRR